MDQCRYNARRSLVQLRQGKIVKSMSVAGAGNWSISGENLWCLAESNWKYSSQKQLRNYNKLYCSFAIDAILHG
jgi:hypothetical protein